MKSRQYQKEWASVGFITHSQSSGDFKYNVPIKEAPSDVLDKFYEMGEIFDGFILKYDKGLYFSFRRENDAVRAKLILC